MVETIEQFLGRLIPLIVNRWFYLIAHNPYAEVYICFRQGDAIAAEDAPDGYEMHPVRLMPNLSRQQCTNQVREALRRLPILPEGI